MDNPGSLENRDASKPPSLQDVRLLVQERERFDAWLAALEAKRDSTPERVYSRVSSDYRSRRDGVLRSLAAHIAPLQAWAGTLAERQQSLAALRATHDEERAEAALRHSVGEFTDGQWDEVRGRVDVALQALESEDGQLRSELEDIEHLLRSARQSATPASGVASITTRTPTPSRVIASIANPTPSIAVASVTPAVSTLIDDVDLDVVDLDEAGLITIETGTPARAAAAVPPTVPAPVERGLTPAASVVAQSPTPPSVSIHELFELNESPRQPTPSAGSAPVDEIEAAWQESAARGFGVDELPPQRITQEVAALEKFEVFTGSNPAVRDDTPAPARVAPSKPTPSSASAFDDLAFLRSLTVSPEQTKTLRCTECNTMNFPTEWYCERCGGELAAL
jgi:hypothetical protein